MSPPPTSDGRPRLSRLPCFAGVTWESPRGHGGVAIGRLCAASGNDLDILLSALTNRDAPEVGAITHRSLAGVDDGVVARLTQTSAWIMPHGGDRIVAAIDAWFRPHFAARGEVCELADDVRLAYPEAATKCEALALDAIARGASPRGVSMLLRQSDRWSNTPSPAPERLRARTAQLAPLLRPSRVVAVGAANVGKSSLLNALARRTVAIAMDCAGTTRDAVAARIELDGVEVDWFDTPGIRATDDPVERASQQIAGRLIADADLVIEVTAPGVGGVPISTNAARLLVCTQIDRDPERRSDEARAARACVSATERTGLADLAMTIRRALVSDEALADDTPWLFDERLATAP